MNKRKTLLGSMVVSLSVASCGGSGSDPSIETSGSSGDQSNGGVSSQFVLPTDAESLQNALYTRYISANDFDVWRCARSGASTAEVAFSLPLPGTLGDGLIGNQYELSTGGVTSFSWQALDGTSIRTTTLDSSAVTDTTNYLFEGESRYSFSWNGATFICEVLDNTVVFGGASNTDGETRDLAVENARIPMSNRPSSAVAVTTFDPIFGENLTEMLATFPNGLRTSCVDWDLVRDQPRDCGTNFDVGETDFVIRPFSAGQTIDGIFRTAPNQLTLTASGEITIGDGISSSVFGIDRGTSGDLAGRYYLSGYTITMEFNGNIYHSLAGILDDSTGEVESLFLANRLFPRNQ